MDFDPNDYKGLEEINMIDPVAESSKGVTLEELFKEGFDDPYQDSQMPEEPTTQVPERTVDYLPEDDDINLADYDDPTLMNDYEYMATNRPTHSGEGIYSKNWPDTPTESIKSWHSDNY